jgi:hypothetical protein
MCVNYTLIIVILKKRLIFLWVLASIGAVVEMGVLSTLKQLLFMESNQSCDNACIMIYQRTAL